ncbi:hypothetical protein HYDPIDRAFT_33052 [Hydnomerulius pinastri MD-312]|uniref:BTB domain-containing protein n=1 Tax=Hydnomerulius pinastri MD-312 TaxID=994086 RepID=A0A0C9W9N0_9AGAM|nr:hypothetical protein HYDPIDRAFT_33052 [Hydnomerulius pinastri MD-312]
MANIRYEESAENEEVPSGTPIDDYGYETWSDSDLDDEEQPEPVVPLASKEADQSDGESDLGASDTFVSSNGDETGSDEGLFVDNNATRLRSLGSRHVFVNDTASQTWYTLLSYLYTGKITLLPMMSSGTRPKESSTSPSEEPKCSAKSMYRLACKVGLGDLRNEALTWIRGGLTEHNILRELSCRLLSRFGNCFVPSVDFSLT